MTSDLRQQIRELIDDGARPITVHEITSGRPPALRRLPSGHRFRPARAAAVAAGVVAVGCAGAVIATQAGGTPAPAPAVVTNPAGHTILTAAAVQRVVARSAAVFGTSGRAQIRYRDMLPGSTLDYGTTDVTFSGRNISVVRRDSSPGGHPAPTTYAQRLVDGQYYYNAEWPPNKGWKHVAGDHSAAARLSVADPRTLLRELTPLARFVTAGHKEVGGVELWLLRATRPDRTPMPRLSGQTMPGEHVTALSLWVDRHGVVHEISARLAVGARGPSTTLTVTFTGLGRPQTVKAPAHATRVGG
jgi:hypothetical protein